MNEVQLIRRIQKMAGASKMALGIGDDCAVYRPRSGEDLLFTTDQMIEGVHFLESAKPGAVGERALARSLSDIAAMGGVPRFCLVTVAVPKDKSGDWTMSFFRGLLRLAKKAGTELAGGDLAQSDKVHLDVMVCGSVAKGKALRRDGARPGDLIYVSGPLGRAWDTPIRPRLVFGQSLVDKATACMDLSDGISRDLHRLCIASGVAAELDMVPIYRASTVHRALHGGEDYELLFTLPARVSAPKGSTRVGRIVKGKPGVVKFLGNLLPPAGYQHLE